MKIKRKHRNLLIALAIGDGYVNNNGYIDIWHSPKQKEYVDYKYSLVKEYCGIKPYIKQFSSGFYSYGFRTKSTEFIKLLRRIIYKNGKKTITEKLLNRLTPRELALWWMDDGSMSKRINKHTGRVKGLIFTLSTCVSREQNQIILDWFKRTHDISFTIRKMKNNYALVCGTREGKKLSRLIEPYVINSMKYKIFIN